MGMRSTLKMKEFAMGELLKSLLGPLVMLCLAGGPLRASAQDWTTYEGKAPLTIQYPSTWSAQEWQALPSTVEPTMRADLQALVATLGIPEMMGMDHTAMIAQSPFMTPLLHLQGLNGEEVIAGVEVPPMAGMSGMMHVMIGPYLNKDPVGDSSDGINKIRLHLAIGTSGIGVLFMAAPKAIFDQVNTQVFDRMSRSLAVK